jgi:hypothetical protein
MVNYIWVTTKREFIHKYPGAPEAVAFLRNEHRHIFHFKVYLEVKHDNRDVEFIMFKRELTGIIGEWKRFRESMSCEKMANKLYEVLSSRYPKREIKIEISEDGENGILYDYSLSSLITKFK